MRIYENFIDDVFMYSDSMETENVYFLRNFEVNKHTELLICFP